MGTQTVSLTFDFDAVSPWVLESEPGPTSISRGIFGARVGVPRILELLSEYGIKATFFTPGHTIDTFPERAEEIWSAGHGLQHHGWSHTNPTEFDDRQAEREDINRGISSNENITGKAPTGYRSPAWDFSEHTLTI